MKEQQPLVWSDELPTEPGFYWWQDVSLPLPRTRKDWIVYVEQIGETLQAYIPCSRRAYPLSAMPGQWAGPIARPASEPQEQEWVRLADLRPGAIFETRGKVRAVKRWSGRLYEDNHKVEATSLESGTYMLFHCSDTELVREIAIG